MLHTKDKCCPITDPHAQNLSDFGRGPLADYIIILHIKALGVAILDIKIVSNCIFNSTDKGKALRKQSLHGEIAASLHYNFLI